MAQFAQHVVDGLFGDLLPARLAEHEVRVEVDADQQSLVVEHLLEVRYQPLLIDRVPGKTAPDVVIHPAAGHGVERRRDDRESVVLGKPSVGAQREIEAHRRRELGRGTESTPGRVERPGQLCQGLIQLGHTGQVGRRRDLRGAADRVGESLDVLADVVGTVLPHVVDRLDEAQEVRLGKYVPP